MSPAAAPSLPEVTNAPEWTVSELAGALRRTLEDRFGHVRLRGEISGYKGPHASGHAYFCLKDREARLDAVIWKTAFARLRFKPQEGLEVIATGRITTFPGKSTYQIVIESLEPAGVGALMALLDERRRTLAAEGLFAAERKRRPPFLPRVVGVVTSPTGSVIRDILHRLEDRFPRHVLVWPVRVQGETCGTEVAAGIAGLNALPPGGPIPRPDVLIVARGGGSLEDLWGFNDEAVVRAAAASTIPLISAIGHETDWTLLDHVADLRAPTPTGAAEMAVPVWQDLVFQVAALAARSREATGRVVEARRTELRSAARALPSAEGLLATRRQRLDLAATRLAPALLAHARLHETRLRTASDALARHTPRIELATARTRLDAVGTKPQDAIRRGLRERGDRLGDLAGRLLVARNAVLHAERLRLDRCRERIAGLAGRAEHAARGGLERRRAQVGAAAGLLQSLGYRSVLERGYALVRDGEGRAVRRAEGVVAGRALEIEFADDRRRVLAEGGSVQASRAPRKAAPLVQDTLFDM
ncbi:exodeoxyribonuclease VII large subunit [uncultured Enterovirga sp.]|uniref:exodeoxyribonuclease VII large subunit n=1 Tax=uncultured Enterovirga sp. TaxID=2026352 RepID=UPI0035C9D166